ncbi:target of Myb protein 1-like isoform X2 [Esox lucius]|uniref:target of Myb protein 1-like isoform X2 n=1 Tax=Esox lucius TaxID=8010 RepID=UPI0014769B40|nr:target of Myb protein 1-like isoform X2 [Esox lucius]
MEFLIGSPFSTPVGQRIERATSATLQAEDWALNMEICDIINETDEGPKDAVRAIKKRIVGNKSYKEIMLALTVLEACVKNCGHRFHVLVASQDFVEGVLVRAILPKNNPPTTLHDRVLSLIQAWADAFRSSPSLVGVVCVYDDLRKRGLEFPMTDLDALSPIHTPHRSIPENGSSVTETAPQPQSEASTPTQSALTAFPPQLSDGPVSVSHAQMQKLRADLALVRGNLTVMSEILNELTPGQTQLEDTELLQQLYQVCKEMQSRVVELIPRLVDEGLIEELLVVNDDLNNAFIRYERFDRLHKAQRTTTEQTPATASVIDLSPMPQSIRQPATTSIAPSQPAIGGASDQRQAVNCSALEEEEEEFDMFAQTRGSSLADQRRRVRYEDPGAVEGLAGALDTRLQIPPSKPNNSTLEDIDRWLSADTDNQAETGNREGLTSEEFDKFLEERAKVDDQIPSAHTRPPVTSRLPQQPARQQESLHDQLFSL